MEIQQIANLLGDEGKNKFGTRKWYVMNEQDK